MDLQTAWDILAQPPVYTPEEMISRAVHQELLGQVETYPNIVQDILNNHATLYCKPARSEGCKPQAGWTFNYPKPTSRQN